MQTMRAEKRTTLTEVVRGTGWFRVGRWFSLAVALVLLTGLSAYGQFESASVLGYVRDSSGAAIPNSTVTLANTATGITQKATSDGDGRYEFSSVPIGSYTVATEASGFQRVQTAPFTVTTNARQRVDVEMKPGSVSEAVTVSAAPSVLVAAPGQVEAVSEEVRIASAIGGRVRSVLVKEGDRVRRGQRLAVLQNDDLSARARALQAGAVLSRRQSARRHALLEHGLISREECEQADSDAEVVSLRP